MKRDNLWLVGDIAMVYVALIVMRFEDLCLLPQVENILKNTESL